MARLHTVKKARTTSGQVCGRCGRPILRGDLYYWWATRLGRMSTRYVRCADHYPRASEMASGYRSIAYGISESIEDVIKDGGDPADIAIALQSASEDVRNDIVEQLHESARNIEEGFGHPTSATDELEERASNFDDWADALEQASDAVTELANEFELESTDSGRAEEIQEEIDGLVTDAVGECPE